MAGREAVKSRILNHRVGTDLVELSRIGNSFVGWKVSGRLFSLLASSVIYNVNTTLPTLCIVVCNQLGTGLCGEVDGCDV